MLRPHRQYRCPTRDVGSAKPNPWGLYDVYGNVWEWCSSLYRPYPYRADDGREDPKAQGKRVPRGGSWIAFPRYVRSGFRFKADPAKPWKRYHFGFRVVVGTRE